MRWVRERECTGRVSQNANILTHQPKPLVSPERYGLSGLASAFG